VIKQDCPNIERQDELDLMLDKLVVISILDMANDAKSNQMSLVIAGIAKVNSRLSQSIVNLVEYLTSKEQLFEVIKTPHRTDMLNEIKTHLYSRP
jgi:hypothetical protein